MSDYSFLFDLDSTITKAELLPRIASLVGLEKELEVLTEAEMTQGENFEKSFCERVELLKDIPISQASKIVKSVPVNMEIVKFIAENPLRCIIVTGNLDVWIKELIEDFGMSGRCFSSAANYYGDKLIGVKEVLNKGSVAREIKTLKVAIGDGTNDLPMFKEANLAIAFGGARTPYKKVIEACHKLFFDEHELCKYLRALL